MILNTFNRVTRGTTSEALEHKFRNSTEISSCSCTVIDRAMVIHTSAVYAWRRASVDGGCASLLCALRLDAWVAESAALDAAALPAPLPFMKRRERAELCIAASVTGIMYPCT